MVVVCVKLPDVPVMVTVAAPVVAEPLAVRVSVLVVEAGLGLKAAVTPLGRPEADKLTVLLKPFCGVTVMVLVPAAPCVMLRLVGDAERAKFGARETVSATVAEWVKLPDVPVMVTVAVPAVAVPLAVRVSVLVVEAGLGLKAAVTPLGRPEADKLTVLLKPFCGVTVMVLVLAVPCVMPRLVGDAERAKFGGGAVTVRRRDVECLKLPEVPVIVTVAVPVFAVALAVKVNVLVVEEGFGLKAAVTPLGSPEAARLTLLLKPPCGVTVMVLVPFAPWRMLSETGEAVSEKFGGAAVMVRLAVVVEVKFPEVPVIVTVAVPVVAVIPAVKVSVLVAEEGLGLKAAVTPLGRPEADKLTVLLKPFCGVTVMVLEPFAFWTTLRLLGEAERV